MRIGISELSDAILFAFAALREGKKIAADGKFTVGDLPHLWSLIGPLRAALAGMGDIPAEFMDIDSEEGKQLALLVKNQLEAQGYTITNIEELVKNGLAFIGAGITFYKSFPSKDGDSTT